MLRLQSSLQTWSLSSDNDDDDDADVSENDDDNFCIGFGCSVFPTVDSEANEIPQC